MSTHKWADVHRADCRSCGHQWTSHGDDKAPQWEPACWFLVNGVRCPCTGYAPPVEDVPEPVATEHDDFEGTPGMRALRARTTAR